jgi:hypothetical protein
MASMTFGIYVIVTSRCWSNEVDGTYGAGPFIFLGKVSSTSPALQGLHTMNALIRKTKLVTMILNVVVVSPPPFFARNEASRHLGGCLKSGMEKRQRGKETDLWEWEVGGDWGRGNLCA